MDAPDLVAKRPGQRASMPAADNLDHDPPILDPLDGLVARVDPELLADSLLDRDLAAFTYSTWHGMHDARRCDIDRRIEPSTQQCAAREDGAGPPARRIRRGEHGTGARWFS